VITAPVIRLVWALSRLDRPVSIYPTVAAAQSPGSVLPFRSSPDGAGSDDAVLPLDDRRPVSWLQEADPASLPCGGYHADQAAAQWFEDMLTQITGSLFEAGLTLQTALDLPPVCCGRRPSMPLICWTARSARRASRPIPGRTPASAPRMV